jgi:hypothetical protein
MLSRLRRLVNEISVGTLTKTLSNILAELLKPFVLLLLAWFGTFLVSWIGGWLSYQLPLPVWALLVGSLFLLLLPILFSRAWKGIRGNTLQEHHGLFWKFEDHELSGEGPFCPRDKRTLKVVLSRHGFSDMIDALENQEPGNPYIVLKCPQCDFETSVQVENLDQLRDDVQDKITARKR